MAVVNRSTAGRYARSWDVEREKGATVARKTNNATLARIIFKLLAENENTQNGERGKLGFDCLPFSKARREVFIWRCWCDRNKYATNECEWK